MITYGFERNSLRWELSYVHLRQTVHHCLVTSLQREQFRNIDIRASAHFPAYCLSDLFPELLLFFFPLSGSICGRGVYPLAYSVFSVGSCLVWLAVGLFLPRDAWATRNPVDLDFYAVAVAEYSGIVDNHSCKLLPWRWVQVYCPSDGRLRIIENEYFHDSVQLLCPCFCAGHLKCNSDGTLHSVEHHHSFHANAGVEDCPDISVCTHHCSPHSPIICSRSICPPHPDT